MDKGEAMHFVSKTEDKQYRINGIVIKGVQNHMGYGYKLEG